MSQDIIADALNQIMNNKRAKKNFVVVNRFLKVLLKVLDIAKTEGYIEDYKIDGTKLQINFTDKLNECRAIKPRFSFTKESIEKYIRRYLPANDMGLLLVSTNKGMITHTDAIEKNLGGCLIAYFY